MSQIDVEHQPQRRIGVRVLHQLAAERGQRGDADLDLLVAERNADHREAQTIPATNVAQAGNRPPHTSQMTLPSKRHGLSPTEPAYAVALLVIR